MEEKKYEQIRELMSTVVFVYVVTRFCPRVIRLVCIKFMGL